MGELKITRKFAVLDIDKCIGCMECMFACSRRFGEIGFNRSSIRIRSAGGIERGFTIVVCRACKDPPCAKACPTGALKLREGGGVLLDKDKCIGCELCAKICIVGAVFWDSGHSKPEICIHCGICTNYCSHNVIGMVEA